MAIDKTSVYKKFAETYKTHDRGLFILAPSGAGKTHFIKNQKEMDWMDGDELWIATGAHPDRPWWLAGEGSEEIFEIDRRSDVITMEAKELGFWIIGASNYSLRPDAIVIPDWEIHQSWIAHREKNAYDGGATASTLDSVIKHRERILEWETKGVPKFETVEEAANFLASQKTPS